MNKTIIISNIKGGVGKTTTAVNLAVALSKNHKVTVFDLDTTQTSAYFFSKRKDITCYSDMTLEEFIKTLRLTDGIKIIDSAGYLNKKAVHGLFKSDLVIMPTMIETVDIIGAIETIRKYKEIESNGLKLNVKILPNKIHHSTNQDTIIDQFKQLGDCSILPLVKEYRSYSKAFTMNQGIVEYKKALPSTIENFNEFVKEVENEIK